jgi:hypothetical protein
MRHNKVDRTKLLRNKRIFKVRKFCEILVGAFILVHFACSFGDEEPVSQMEISGQIFLTSDEILKILNIQRGAPISVEGETAKYESILSNHPRIQYAQVRKRGMVLEIEIKEKPVIGIVHVEDHMYELDENLQIISKDDVRAKWVPVMRGNFQVQDGSLSGTGFVTFQKQVEHLLKTYPELGQRISEIELDRFGEILIYTHYPVRATIQIGGFISNKQARKLYSSLSYLEAESESPRYMDLREEDAFFY